ncbi:hypothetical protein bcere0009_30720 [Bacillus cereus R309803]|nr:hypothetical protein bcere0009_30720 [Bacillus cereus R309803]
MILSVIEKNGVSMNIVSLRNFWNTKEMEKIISPSLSSNYI